MVKLFSPIIGLIGLFVLATVNPLLAEPLSISHIQSYQLGPAGESDYDGQVVDCRGGIVVDLYFGGWTKLTLYDPATPNAWAGIVVKTQSHDFDQITPGQWIAFDQVMVEERSGNTQLTYDPAVSTLTLTGENYPLPDPLEITDPAFTEPYESMLVKLPDVTVSRIDLGLYGDNYELTNAAGAFLAADFYNPDKTGDYHPLVTPGRHFQSVSGLLEQKVKNSQDYFQLMTLSSGSFVIPEPASTLLTSLALALLARRRGRRSCRSRPASPPFPTTFSNPKSLCTLSRTC